MSELATAARPAAIIAKTARRVAVALTMSIGVGLLMMSVWRSSPSSLFLRTIILGLSATAAFGLFEAWPRSLPQWLRRWALQVVAVGASHAGDDVANLRSVHAGECPAASAAHGARRMAATA